jgi:hypothetical protein
MFCRARALLATPSSAPVNMHNLIKKTERKKKKKSGLLKKLAQQNKKINKIKQF